jgi:hypothetical protein
MFDVDPLSGLNRIDQLIQPTAVQMDGLFRTDFMATVAADTFLIFDASPLINKADCLHRTAFNAGTASDASVPDHPGSHGKRIFEKRFNKPLVPRHPIQSKTSGGYPGPLKIRHFHIG